PARPSRGEGEQPCNGGSARIRSAAQRLAFEEQNFALEGGDGVWLKSPSLQRRRRVVGYPSGQRGQTVNLLAYAFAGSNPAPTTTRISRQNRAKSPVFSVVSSHSPICEPRAFVLLASLADFSKTMLRK